jgi:hypothetical protein
MRIPRPQKRYRCRDCSRVLPAWRPAAQRPNGAMLRHHLGDLHPDHVRPYLDRMWAAGNTSRESNCVMYAVAISRTCTVNGGTR